MKRSGIFFMVLAVSLVLTAAGCSKKTSEQANLTGTGFDSLSTSEELAQLPQANTGANQQGAVEVLPIETSPVTQGVPVPPQISSRTQKMTTEAVNIATQTAGLLPNLNHEQQIQTALKNAGLYNGAIDGKIGPASKGAVEAFQKQNGLKADGKVGPKTWAALEPYVNGGSSSSTVAQEASAQTTD